MSMPLSSLTPRFGAYSQATVQRRAEAEATEEIAQKDIFERLEDRYRSNPEDFVVSDDGTVEWQGEELSQLESELMRRFPGNMYQWLQKPIEYQESQREKLVPIDQQLAKAKFPVSEAVATLLERTWAGSWLDPSLLETGQR